MATRYWIAASICAVAVSGIAGCRTGRLAPAQPDPRNIAALQAQAEGATRSGHAEERLRVLQKLAELQPQNAAAQADWATALVQAYDYDQARPVVQRILAVDPRNERAYYLRGQMAYKDDPNPRDLAQAAADFEKVVQLNPANFEAQRYLGRIYMRRNQPRQAIAHYQAIGRGRPYASGHFLELSRAWRAVGDTRRADALLRRFTAMKQLNLDMQEMVNQAVRNPDDWDNLVQLGLLLLHCVESDADSYNLYHYRYTNGEVKAPAYYLRQAAALRPHESRVLAASQQLEAAYQRHLQAAQNALRRGNRVAASGALDHAMVLRPDDPRTVAALRNAATAGITVLPGARS